MGSSCLRPPQAAAYARFVGRPSPVLSEPTMHAIPASRTIMSFTSEPEAKRFFVQKVVAEAEREGVPLSKAERHMLSWSESDPEFTPDLELAASLDQQMSDKEYETKVSGLLRRAYDRDKS